MAHKGVVYDAAFIFFGMVCFISVMAEESTVDYNVTDQAVEQTTTDMPNEQTTLDLANGNATTDDSNSTPQPDDPGNGCGSFRVSGIALALTTVLCWIRL